jgi:hypothetical protein
MTNLLPELAELPADAQLDGEVIAWGDDNTPDFHRLSRRMRHGDVSIPVTYMAFDVLALDCEPTLRLPYLERYALLEEIVLDAPPSLVDVIASFEDGAALWGEGAHGADVQASVCGSREGRLGPLLRPVGPPRPPCPPTRRLGSPAGGSF